ncbi:MAG TPA: hypothetical protein VEL76_18000 [Gemmataceae bacterium]|nr:hypothetical protein [Gemmataceae bacterium]
MRKGTIRGRLWLLGGLLLGIVGCGDDEQTWVIARTKDQLTSVTSKLTEVKGLLKKAVDVQAEKKQPISVTDESVLQAIATVKDKENGLRRIGERLQRVKEISERAKDKTTAEYSKELLDKYRSGIQESLVNLEKEEKALRAVLAQAREAADQGGKGKIDELEREIKSGIDAFELLTKQR